MAGLSVEAMEGRLIAQRKVLGMIVAELSRTEGEAGDLWAGLDRRSSLSNHEEDPGVLPTSESAIEAAIADEIRLIMDVAQRHLSEGGR